MMLWQCGGKRFPSSPGYILLVLMSAELMIMYMETIVGVYRIVLTEIYRYLYV